MKDNTNAVQTLIDWQGGTMAELARVANVSRVAIFKMHAVQRVSAPTAALLARLPGCPLTFTEMRPDLPSWHADEYDTPETRAAVKAQIVYIRERDKAAAKKTALVAKTLANAAKKRAANPRNNRSLKRMDAK